MWKSASETIAQPEASLGLWGFTSTMISAQSACPWHTMVCTQQIWAVMVALWKPPQMMPHLQSTTVLAAGWDMERHTACISFESQTGVDVDPWEREGASLSPDRLDISAKVLDKELQCPGGFPLTKCRPETVALLFFHPCWWGIKLWTKKAWSQSKQIFIKKNWKKREIKLRKVRETPRKEKLPRALSRKFWTRTPVISTKVA